MSNIKSAFTAAFAILCLAAIGCAPTTNHHVTSRGVVSTTSGGPQEVWLVMSEVASDLGA
jgi:hypothetical protein